METVMDKEKLEAALEAASEAARQVRRECEGAHKAARQEIEARFADRLNQTQQAVRDAESALQEHIATNAAHPWEGKRVVKEETRWRRGYGYGSTTSEVFGVVEVRRLDTALPANLSEWRLPKIGEPFVRAVKKDGSVGVALADTKLSPIWKPAPATQEGNEG